VFACGLPQVVALVPQDPVIFAASARETSALAAPNATDAEITAAAEAAAAARFNAPRLPDGYDSSWASVGLMLSGGPKQRTPCARASCATRRLLLLNEATSALDAESVTWRVPGRRGRD